MPYYYLDFIIHIVINYIVLFLINFPDFLKFFNCNMLIKNELKQKNDILKKMLMFFWNMPI